MPPKRNINFIPTTSRLVDFWIQKYLPRSIIKSLRLVYTFLVFSILWFNQNIFVLRLKLSFTDQQPKLGGKNYSKTYRLALETELNKGITSLLNQNARKNFGGQILTPLTLLGLLVVAHIFHGFFKYLFLGIVDDCLAVLWWIFLVTLVLWISLKWVFFEIIKKYWFYSKILF